MKLTKSLLILSAIAGLGLSTVSAEAPITYQVTGPVLALTDSVITVQKGKEKWEIARDSSSKVTGDVKVGSKVTITYSMTASTIEVKPEKMAKPAKADKAPKAPKADKKAAPAAASADMPAAATASPAETPNL